MNLETIYYITQIIAVAAILISLVAIWFQMRQSTKIERAAAQREETNPPPTENKAAAEILRRFNILQPKAKSKSKEETYGGNSGRRTQERDDGAMVRDMEADTSKKEDETKGRQGGGEGNGSRASRQSREESRGRGSSKKSAEREVKRERKDEKERLCGEHRSKKEARWDCKDLI